MFSRIYSQFYYKSPDKNIILDIDTHCWSYNLMTFYVEVDKKKFKAHCKINLNVLINYCLSTLKVTLDN